MDKPLTIAFHNMDTDPAAEQDIRRHVERLENRFGKLVACRVSVEALHQKHKTGNTFEVHITMSVAGSDLVVSREPHHQAERHAHPDAMSAIHDAFKTAERMLDRHSDPRHKRSLSTSPHNIDAIGG